jgi:uncharacterized membrane protein SpoIIM required for sporulation
MTAQSVVVNAGPRRMPFGMAVFMNATVYLFLGAVAAAYAAWSDIGAPLAPKTGTSSTLELFWHNLGVLVWLATGLCTGGLLTVAVLGLNGIVLGWVVGKELAGDNVQALLTGVLPHFPFEITAYVISAAASMRLGTELLTWIRRRSEFSALGWRTWVQVQTVAVGLLLVAAIVEANISHV